MTQEDITQRPHSCGISRDYIPNLDDWTREMATKMVELFIHFAGHKWCLLCNAPIMVTEWEETHLDIHMWEEHGDTEIMELYFKLMKEHVIPALSMP